MSSDIFRSIIHCSLTVNSTTLYTYENYQLAHSINNLNSLEIISQELGIINASKTLIGSIPIVTSQSVTNTNLALYFMKKSVSNTDGSNDLITVIIIVHKNVNKMIILSSMKKIIDKYIAFKQTLDAASGEQSKNKQGEFKIVMKQIIKVEEANQDSTLATFNYGAINSGDPERSYQASATHLLLANEEVDEVRDIMADNINKMMSRGDKINLLVDQTDRLASSASIFQRKAQMVKHKMWLNKTKFKITIILAALLLLYFLIGWGCGLPTYSKCIRH